MNIIKNHRDYLKQQSDIRLRAFWGLIDIQTMSMLVWLLCGQSSVKTELALGIHTNSSVYPIRCCLV